jgi:hypothetical protein
MNAESAFLQSILTPRLTLVPTFRRENQAQETGAVAKDEAGSQEWQTNDYGGLPNQWSR